MATIEFSQAFLNLVPTTVFRLGSGSSSPGLGTYSQCGLLAPNTWYHRSAIEVFSGPVPTGWANSTVMNNYLTSNLLIQYLGAESNGTELNYGATLGPVVLGPTTRINTIYRKATASGTATWFWIRTFNGGTPLQEIIGTIGLSGSGADLIMNDTNIVTGQYYRLCDIKLTFPSSWTY